VPIPKRYIIVAAHQRIKGKNITVAIIGTTITLMFELMKSPEASIIHAPIFISVHRHAIIIIYIRVPTPIATAAAIFPL
jgi:hypothetical protein